MLIAFYTKAVYIFRMREYLNSQPSLSKIIDPSVLSYQQMRCAVQNLVLEASATVEEPVGLGDKDRAKRSTEDNTVQGEVNSVQVEVNTVQVEVNTVQVEVITVQVEVITVQVEVNTVQVEDNTVQVEVNTVQVEVNTVQVEVILYRYRSILYS